MYTNTSCTVYLESENYNRRHIEKCFFVETKTARHDKNGMSYNESAFVMFDIQDELTFSEGKDFLIKGETDLIIDNSGPQAFSQSMKALNQTYNVYTIMAADRKDYGSRSMQHMEISCK